MFQIVIMQPSIKRLLIYFIRKLRLPNDPENIKTTIENIRANAEMSGVSLWVLVAAIFIASLGLNTNSTAVIIGAMLVSPLMGPIMGFGLGLGLNDFNLIKKAVRNFISSVVISIIASTIYFSISPVKGAGSELLARTSPTIYDVLIAFFGGVAGIIAGASELRRSNVIPGVAIATALMPPLCTMGYGIASGNLSYTAGAFYLFLINSVFISLATYFIVRLLNYPRLTTAESGVNRRMPWLITGITVLLIAPSIYLTYHIVKKYFYQQDSQTFIKNEVQDNNHIVVSSSLDYKPGNSTLELVMMGDIIDSAYKEELQSRMSKYGLYHCKLVLYQGPDSRAAMKGQFDELNSGVKLNNASIKNLYLMSDSLWRELHKIKLDDSVEVQLARDIRGLDSGLYHLSVQRNFSFNPARNAYDTLWEVSASFKDPIPKIRRTTLDSLLKAKLHADYVRFTLE